MVLQLLHETDLCLLLHGLVGGTILAYTERIVCPDKLDRHLHESSHADGGLHIVGEHKECAASGDNATVQIHAYADAGHGELAHTCLEERAREIVVTHVLCLLLEAIGLVRVAEVGRRAHHVAHLLCKHTETVGRGCTRSCITRLHESAPVDLRSIA